VIVNVGLDRIVQSYRVGRLTDVPTFATTRNVWFPGARCEYDIVPAAPLPQRTNGDAPSIEHPNDTGAALLPEATGPFPIASEYVNVADPEYDTFDGLDVIVGAGELGPPDAAVAYDPSATRPKTPSRATARVALLGVSNL